MHHWKHVHIHLQICYYTPMTLLHFKRQSFNTNACTENSPNTIFLYNTGTTKKFWEVKQFHVFNKPYIHTPSSYLLYQHHSNRSTAQNIKQTKKDNMEKG